jgi:hypothetical protein
MCVYWSSQLLRVKLLTIDEKLSLREVHCIGLSFSHATFSNFLANKFELCCQIWSFLYVERIQKC